MKTKPNTTFDLPKVRNEITAAHEATARWEKTLDFFPTPAVYWTKMIEFAGPNLKNALSRGVVYIEIREKAAAPNGYDKPRFVIKGESVFDNKAER